MKLKSTLATGCREWTRTPRADVLVVPLPISQSKPDATVLGGVPPEIRRRISELRDQWSVGSEVGQLDNLIVSGGSPLRRIALVSLGKDWSSPRGAASGAAGRTSQNAIALDAVRTAAANAARWCMRHNLRRMLVAAAPLREAAGDDAPAAWAESTVLAGFQFDRLRSKNARSDAPTAAESLIFVDDQPPSAAIRSRLSAAVVVGECVNLARRIGHEPPNVINPVTLASLAVAEARRVGLRCRVLDHRRLARLRMNAMLAVGRGSAVQPRLIVLEHRGASPAQRPVVLVGKAVTLDTGGYSIKPAESMPDMKYDKCGGVAVLAALVAAARLRLRRHVVGLIAAAENMISGEAYRPGDILTAMNGKTIEVVNTDAEGRLVLADALTYAQRVFRPSTIIDLATLTGACTVALGHHAAALYATDDELAAALLDAGQAAGDRLWRMPLWPEYRRQIEGTDSDLKNSGGRPGGSITAAMFLKEFVNEDVPWAHLDIAGTAHTDRDTPLCPKGATGFGVRLLTRYLSQMP